MLHSISHQTIFDFETTPKSVVQRLHLTPPGRPYQRVLEWEVQISGGTIELESDDYHGNHIHLCHHDMASKRIEIACRGRVEVTDTTGIVGAHDNAIPIAQFLNATPLSKPGPLIRRLSKEMNDFRKAHEDDDVAILHELSSRILKRIRYTKGTTDTTTTAEEAMKLGSGVCQDHVHAFIAAARLLGYPARYVSGYLMLEETNEQEASHAWAEAHVASLGWVGLDISNVISPDDRYVKLATGFDYLDVAPVAGVKFGSAEERLSTTIVMHQQ